MTTDNEQRGPLDGLGPDDPLDGESALFVLSLAMDGRPVPADLEQRARRFAEQDEGCRAALADLEAIHGVLAGEAALAAPAGFTEQVLAARGAARGAANAGGGGTILVLARRLAMAAALVLATTLGWQLTHPGELIADPDMDTQPHVIDGFRPDAFGPVDLDGGLERLLPAPVPTSGLTDADLQDDDPRAEDDR